tara:strand:+ start:1107 stop:1847 length:741 start_codon:yes stop_codon:yes gene_type:complete
MAMKRATGKKSKAISDQSGFEIPYTSLVTQWDGLRVEPSEFDPKHPQLTPAKNVVDATALFKPRPDNDQELTIFSVGYSYDPFADPRSKPGFGMKGNGNVATIDFTSFKYGPEATGVAGTGATGAEIVGIEVNGVSGSGGTGAVGVEALEVSIAEAGVAGTGAVGTEVPTVSIAEAGVAGTGAVGTEDIDISGWGLGSWGSGVWGDELKIEVSGLAGTGAVGTESVETDTGWGTTTWGEGAWGDFE